MFQSDSSRNRSESRRRRRRGNLNGVQSVATLTGAGPVVASGAWKHAELQAVASDRKVLGFRRIASARALVAATTSTTTELLEWYAVLIEETRRLDMEWWRPSVAPLRRVGLAISWCLMPLGGLLAGWTASTTGITTSLLIFAATYLTVTMAPALIPRWREMNTPVRAETSSSQANPTA